MIMKKLAKKTIQNAKAIKGGGFGKGTKKATTRATWSRIELL